MIILVMYEEQDNKESALRQNKIGELDVVFNNTEL